MAEFYSSKNRPVYVKAGEWRSKTNSDEGAMGELYRDLRRELSVIVLDSKVMGSNYVQNLGFWGVEGFERYEYKTITSFQWTELVYESVKLRVAKLEEKRQQLGEDLESFSKRLGEKAGQAYKHNLNLLNLERENRELGIDPQLMDRPYLTDSNLDYRYLIDRLVFLNCLHLAMTIDRYYLIHVPAKYRLTPLLPCFLKSLTATINISDADFKKLVENVVSFNKTLYDQLAIAEPAFIADLRLDFAFELMHLEKKYAQEQVEASISSWLAYRGIKTSDNPLAEMASLLSEMDLPYAKKLNEHLAMLSESRRLSLDSYYQRQQNVEAARKRREAEEEAARKRAKAEEEERRRGLILPLPNNEKLELVWIAGGRLTMEGGHEINLEEFRMGKYPVTQGQYQAVMGNNPSHFSGSGKENHPVENVSWEMAKKFCEKLSQDLKKQGFEGKIDLPSESQWEYACSAGTNTKYWFGDDENQLKTHAWYEDNSNRTTHSVKEAENTHTNPWGLVDMHGNVWEWCADNWTGTVSELPKDGKPLLNKGNSGRHPMRGGSWFLDRRNCRSSCRNSDYARYFDSNFGFRVVCVFG